jgi:peptide/nickel transport system ATP-binding protein
LATGEVSINIANSLQGPLTMLLRVSGLKTHFYMQNEVRKVLNGVDLAIDAGQVLAVVGESGCGKSILGFSILGQIPKPGRIVAGEFMFDDRDATDTYARRQLLGNGMAMIFQDPLASVCPVLTVGDQIAEMRYFHRGASWKEAMKQAADMLRLVEISAPERRVREYPHQLSGGMRQRVLIAIALACEPQLLIADSPTTGLDVTIQAQVLELIRKLQRDRDMAVLLMTHDIGVVMEVADRMAIMYAGVIVEEGGVIEVLSGAKHPYTLGLLKSLPRLGAAKGSLYSIPGTPPDSAQLPGGCYFAPRCVHALDVCREKYPPTIACGQDHRVSCWLEVNHGVQNLDS